MDKILDLIDSGKKAGAKLLVGGKREGDKGFFVQPTIFADVKDDHRIAREEVRKMIVPFLLLLIKFSLLFEDFWTGDANFEIQRHE